MASSQPFIIAVPDIALASRAEILTEAALRDILYIVSRWLLFFIVAFLACYLFYAQIYLVYGPKVADVDARLPTLFHSSPRIFWVWFLGSAALAGCLGYWILRFSRVIKPEPAADTVDPNQADPAIASACEAIVNLRHGHEREPAFLIIADGDAPISLMAAAGLGPDAVAPEEPGPIRGLRTSSGLFVQCVGPETIGARSACQTLGAMPGSPPLRGVIIQIPVATLLGPKAHAFGHASRAILRDVAESTATRCPVYVVISGMEEVPGFLEFAHRSPAEYRTSARFGFTLPDSDNSTDDSVAREYDRLIGWYNLSILDFMETGPLQQEGNEALFSLGRWFIQAREPILRFLEAAQPGGGDDPLEMLNCYFVATGDAPDQRAFVESLMRVKVAGDPWSVHWSRQSLAADRTLRRVATGLGAVGGTIALLAWVLIFVDLRPTGWINPLLGLTVAVGWVASWYELLRGFRRRRDQAA